MTSAEAGTITEARPLTPGLPAFAWRHVGLAVVVLGVVLTALSTRYGYHRDELYFRLLRPAWGYVDQPPLTPLVARGMASLSDSLAALRAPATLSLLAAVVLVALLARELGGGAGAQALAAWGFGTAATPLIFGHTLLTASLDMVVWAAVLWLVARALLRDQRAWLAAGVVAGLGLYNKLLVVALLAAIGVGLALAGPRRVLATRWPWLAVGAALVVGLPNLVYQAVNGWPQLAMGRALAEHNAGDVRVDMWWFQLVTLGPPLVVVWVAGMVALWRRPEWRPLRCLVVAYPVLLAFTFVGGAQVYYAWSLLGAFLAAGAVVVARWARTRGRQVAVAALVVLNAAGSAVIALPLIPVDVLGATPFGDINQTARDAVGWPAYVRQVEAAYAALPAADRAHAVVLTGNYGEAGAIDRFGTGLPPVYSAQNALAAYGPPPANATVAVVVLDGGDAPTRWFARCETVTHLDDGVGVDNEEQGGLVAVCRGPRGGWAALWPRLTHLD
ncbi:glycosyltransferase family 39 protein [Xylanimonas sp. McL0601]|uniref:glycosyltransferase family 39 protein n=1 Tax=Xylanimonas sp. McL0601 TaxID=3414739 RepID=UPI003CF62BBD